MKNYQKVNDVTLKEIRTSDPIQLSPIEQNFDLDFLNTETDRLDARRAAQVESNKAALVAIDAEIAENQERIGKCVELGIISISASKRDAQPLPEPAVIS